MGLVKQLRLRLRVLPGLRRCREVCSTVDAMRRNKNIPVVFAHGDADDFVPVAMTRENYAACGAEKELFLAPGAGHGLSYLVERERCEAALLAFLRKHMHSA